MPSPTRSPRVLAKKLIRRSLPPLDRLLQERAQFRSDNARLTREVEIAQAWREKFERENERLRSAAVTQSTPELDYLFIASYGRSGSTLLQGVLCAAPGVLIRGENGDALHRLYEFHQTIAERRDAHLVRSELTSRSSWYGIDGYQTPVALAAMRGLVVNALLRPEPDTRMIGFKEIRWWHKDWRPYLEFLLELFPGARFIINTRDHEAVAQSKWWTERDDPRGMLRRYESRLEEMAGVLGERAYRLHYDDYVANHDVLMDMFAWLGVEMDRPTIDLVMAERHSY